MTDSINFIMYSGPGDFIEVTIAEILSQDTKKKNKVKK
jgi:hypothetical protein